MGFLSPRRGSVGLGGTGLGGRAFGRPGGAGQMGEEAASLPELIEGWEERLLQEPLTALTEFELTS